MEYSFLGITLGYLENAWELCGEVKDGVNESLAHTVCVEKTCVWFLLNSLFSWSPKTRKCSKIHSNAFVGTPNLREPHNKNKGWGTCGMFVHEDDFVCQFVLACTFSTRQHSTGHDTSCCSVNIFTFFETFECTVLLSAGKQLEICGPIHFGTSDWGDSFLAERLVSAGKIKCLVGIYSYSSQKLTIIRYICRRGLERECLSMYVLCWHVHHWALMGPPKSSGKWGSSR